jgi:methyl-accepting chemotaxis protein
VRRDRWKKEATMKHQLVTLVLAVALCTCGPVLWGSKPVQAQDIGTSTDRAVLKAAVHVAAAGLGATAVKADGTYDTDVIRNFVHVVRFLDDQSGYFYVYDSTNTFCIAHATMKDFEGKDKSDYTDSRGLKVAQEFSRLVTATPTGVYLDFYFVNPVSNKEEQKLGYAEMIPGTKLYVGSGVYVK